MTDPRPGGPAPDGGPRTVYGNYLRAYRLRQVDRRREMLAELEHRGWDDAIVLLDTTFDLVVTGCSGRTPT